MSTHPSAYTQALFCDLYLLTMGQAYWQSGRTGSATFSLFIRKYPPERGYFVFAGLASALDFLESFRFAPQDIDYLRSLNRFDTQYLDFLAGVRFTGSVRAMREGSLFFANEPVLEVTGPILEAQLAETFLINCVNVQTILATKAARVVHAAAGRQVIDFGARRTQGVESANDFARAAYLAGFVGTSNVLAAARYGIPLAGTMAHSYITCFEHEIDAFRQYGQSFPEGSVFLVDTYDTLEGTKKAITVALEMRAREQQLRAIRLDSGDLADLSRKARTLLDAAGLPEVRILASGGLDEYSVAELVRAGAPIDGFGVGTKVGVSADAPWTDCAYKLVEYAGRSVLKLSTGKQTLPGPKQVFRIRDTEARYLHDVLACADETMPTADPLLTEVMREGKRTRLDPSLPELRDAFAREITQLDDRHKRLKSPEAYEVRVSAKLQELQGNVVAAAKERELSVH